MLAILCLTLISAQGLAQEADTCAGLPQSNQTGNLLTTYAIGADSMIDDFTYYSYENEKTFQRQADPFPLVFLDSTRGIGLAFTDCSGWVDNALTNSYPDANNEIQSEATKGNNWATANVYANYFDSIYMTPKADSYWRVHENFDQLGPGAILTWCEGGWCKADDSPADTSGDTGHVMVVIDVEKVTDTSTIVANYDFIKDSAGLEFYKVAVIDASDVRHGSECVNGIYYEDTRDYSNSSTEGDAGGVGMGVIYIARWYNKDSLYGDYGTYASVFHNVEADTFVPKNAVGDLNKYKLIRFGFPNASEGTSVVSSNTGEANPSGGAGRGNRGENADLAAREFVEIINPSASDLDLTGYTISDAEAVRHTFPAGITLAPGQAVVVYSGDVLPAASLSCAYAIQASSGDLNLDDAGDTYQLHNAQGALIDAWVYDEMAGSATHSYVYDQASLSWRPHIEAEGGLSASPGTDVQGRSYINCVEFELAADTVTEGSSEALAQVQTLRVLRYGDATEELVVTLGSDETNTDTDAGEVEAPATLTFAATETEQVLTLEILGDTDEEATERYTVLLLSTSNNEVMVGPQSSGQLVILDDDEVTGLAEVLTSLQLYPNPSRDRVTLELAEAEYRALEASLLTASGKQLRSTALTTQGKGQLSVAGLPTGLYLLRLTEAGNTVAVRKIMVQ